MPHRWSCETRPANSLLGHLYRWRHETFIEWSVVITAIYCSHHLLIFKFLCYCRLSAFVQITILLLRFFAAASKELLPVWVLHDLTSPIETAMLEVSQLVGLIVLRLVVNMISLSNRLSKLVAYFWVRPRVKFFTDYVWLVWWSFTSLRRVAFWPRAEGIGAFIEICIWWSSRDFLSSAFDT